MRVLVDNRIQTWNAAGQLLATIFLRIVGTLEIPLVVGNQKILNCRISSFRKSLHWNVFYALNLEMCDNILLLTISLCIPGLGPKLSLIIIWLSLHLKRLGQSPINKLPWNAQDVFCFNCWKDSDDALSFSFRRQFCDAKALQWVSCEKECM